MPLRYAGSARIANEHAEVDSVEQQLDQWTQRRDELIKLVEQLSPSEALEVLSHVVASVTDSTMVAPVLIGCIRGVVERGGSPHESDARASEEAYEAMKDHSPNLGDK